MKAKPLLAPRMPEPADTPEIQYNLDAPTLPAGALGAPRLKW